MKKDLVVTCRKCGHELYIGSWDNRKKMEEVISMDCDNCGEEGYGNWILSRFDTFEE